MNGIFSMRVTVVLGLAGVLAISPAAALADIAIFNPAAIPNPTVIDFESLPLGQITDPNVLIGEGITFPNLDGGESVLGFGNNQLIDVLGSGQFGSDGVIEIAFVDPVDAAGVHYSSNSDLHLIAYDTGGGIIREVIVPATGDWLFFGVDGQGTLIGSIQVHDSAFGFGIDDLTFAAHHVPVPGAVVLGAIGLGLVGYVRRRLH